MQNHRYIICWNVAAIANERDFSTLSLEMCLLVLAQMFWRWQFGNFSKVYVVVTVLKNLTSTLLITLVTCSSKEQVPPKVHLGTFMHWKARGHRMSSPGVSIIVFKKQHVVLFLQHIWKNPCRWNCLQRSRWLNWDIASCKAWLVWHHYFHQALLFGTIYGEHWKDSSKAKAEERAITCHKLACRPAGSPLTYFCMAT